MIPEPQTPSEQHDTANRAVSAVTLPLPGGQRAAELQPGVIFGDKYRIVRRIGSGGMGAVYLAVDTGPLLRSCAIKVLDSTNVDSLYHRRFFNEARIMASLRHPNIVAVTNFGTDAASGLDFYVMDEQLPSRQDAARICSEILHCPCPAFAEKQEPLTLGRLIDDGKTLPEIAIATVALQILSAIEASHSLSPSVVHRDIKPSNILFAPDGRAMLSDFGIAKRIADAVPGSQTSTADSTASNMAPGTWAFAAPEQRHGETVGLAADFYAFGLVLFRALTGGMPNNTGSLPTDMAAKVSHRWAPLFAALLREKPAERLTDADGVRKALEAIAAEGALRKNRRPWRSVPIIAAVAAVAAVCAWSWEKPSASTPTPPEPATETPQQKSENAAQSWCSQYVDTLQSTLEKVVASPELNHSGCVMVPEGKILLSGDIPIDTMEIRLDGGTLLFSPPAAELRSLLAKCKDFIANAPDDAPFPDGILPTKKEWLKVPVSVTVRGGYFDVADGEIQAVVTGPVRKADGTESATLHVFGFSSIVLNRATLDSELEIRGAGQVADIHADGRIGNRRWFDDENPL